MIKQIKGFNKVMNYVLLPLGVTLPRFVRFTTNEIKTYIENSNLDYSENLSMLAGGTIGAATGFAFAWLLDIPNSQMKIFEMIVTVGMCGMLGVVAASSPDDQ